MSWIKRRSQNNTPSPAPVGQLTEPVPMYNPNLTNQWQSNNWYQQKQHAPVQQQGYWGQQGYAEQHNQQIHNQNAQHLPQYPDQNTTHGNSAAKTFHNPQSYGNLQYNQQYSTQNNTFQEVTLQNNESDSWGNWGWGDEDNSNIHAAPSGQEHNTGMNETAALASEEAWNWSVDEAANQEKEQIFEDDNGLKMGKPVTSSSAEQFHTGKMVDSPLSAISNVKRNKLETPQWSIESQVSQESSDDILQTSESDNHLISSSTLSHSPLSGMDNLQPMKDNLHENTSFVYQHVENRENVGHSDNPSQSSFYNNPESHPNSEISQEVSMNPYNKTPSGLQTNFSSTSNTFHQNPYTESVNQSVNLETPPDNSEHPDVPVNSSETFDLMNSTNKTSQHQNFQDNKEIPPINDRNQYLQTGQLSDANQLNFPVETDVISAKSNQEDAFPPPGLRRMVLGQIEQQELAGNPNSFIDEPPQGLSRMVVGQNESNFNTSLNPVNENDTSNFEPINPPEGLRRMVPGESSSPENSLGQTFQTENINIDDSDREFSRIPQLRSATIGADMPPASVPVTAQSNITASNRSETIGAADSSERSGGSTVPTTSSRKTLRKSKDKKLDSQRRDYIEGQVEDSEINSVVSGVRNLSVGDSLINESDDVNMKSEVRRKLSRQDTSESDNEGRNKSSRDRKDRRYKADRKERDYSPDPSRDKRYDRRKYRDRHYEEDADHFSDGERDRNVRDKDYDKRNYSLRKDKDKDRRRRESPREYDRDSRRKREEYYHRYDDSYENEDRSRPSSRTDSMHDSMYRGDRRTEKESKDRRSGKPRDREKHRRSRESYNPYVQGYGGAYDPYNPYYQQYQYQYYENLRRTNPQAYAEIYRKYYEQHARLPPTYGPDDRSSVHSGRSSANEDLAADRYTRQSYYSQSSMQYLGGYYPRDSKTNSISGHYDLEESSMFKAKTQSDLYHIDDSSTKLGRETPPKFVTAHTWCSIRSGRLVNVLPNYPQDGQPALVELAPLEAYLQKDDEFKELANYPGPLTKDVTHKKTVIEYCENKIKNVSSNLDISDPESYILMWELLILLLRQNGKVVGTDIAELLLKKRTENVPARSSSVLSNLSSNTDQLLPHSEGSNPQITEESNESPTSILKEEEVTNKFREYLLYGSEQEALEWAMKQGLWGHALFLASKLGKRTYSNVMVRFANGLTLNDPLQTLYQLLSGKMPAAVSGVADEKWGDWKPHLSMILSNSSLQPDLNRKAITALGDTLMARGSLYAAQFCYLMAEVGFGRYGTENIKIVLLGSNHNKPFSYFATNEAIHMTEIYEYACSLNDPEFAIPELQAYKYLIATRLADHGFLEKALGYLEKIALYIIINPSNVQSSLIHNVYNMADRLKYYDPIGIVDDDENYDENADNRLDNSWLKNLRLLRDNVNSGLTTLDSKSNVTFTDPNEASLYGNSTHDETLQGTWDNSQIYNHQQIADNSQLQWQVEQANQIDTSPEAYQQSQHTEGYSLPSYQQQQEYWSNQQQQQWEPNGNDGTDGQESNAQNYYGSITQNEDEGKPQISIPNQSKGKSIFDDEPLPHEKIQRGKEPPSEMDKSKKQQQNSSGWFGGIFSRLALKPKNQMKLPDDKNPSIVWDQEKKRWVNLEDENNKTESSLKPPPKVSDMKNISPKVLPSPGTNNNSIPQPQLYSNSPNNLNVHSQMQGPNISHQYSTGLSQDNSSLQGNMFKLQKSRNLKKSYIDVFNPGGNAKSTAPSTNLPALPTTDMIPQMNMFVPQPINDPNAPMNFLTQGTPVIQPQHEEFAQGRQ